MILRFILILLFSTSLLAQDAFLVLDTVTQVHLHGYKDNYVSTAKAIEICKKRKLHMTCQPICYFTRDILSSHGISARPVHYVTAEKRNGWNDGHCMLEVWDNERWVLVDMTTRLVFEKDGALLSAKEFLRPDFNEIHPIRFSDALVLAYGDLVYNKIDLTQWLESTFLNEYNLKNWYSRICQTMYY